MIKIWHVNGPCAVAMTAISKRDPRVGGRAKQRIAWSNAQQTAVLSSHRASRHMPSASLGQDASLSFVVIGKEQRKEERDSPAQSCALNDFCDFLA
jgi:hypothetical protein